jgi:hypothetical protein
MQNAKSEACLILHFAFTLMPGRIGEGTSKFNGWWITRNILAAANRAGRMQNAKCKK